jgi:two-component system NtrC family sensor kinase
VSEKKFLNIRPRRSLRTIVMVWFLLLSLVPLMFVTGYSLVKYEQATDNEIVRRLRTTSREYSLMMGDFEKFLAIRRNRHQADPILSSALQNYSVSQLREHVQALVRLSAVALTFTVFNAQGDIVVSYFKDEQGNAIQNIELENANVGLSVASMGTLGSAGHLLSADASGSIGFDLVSAARIDGKSGRRAGYIEEIINIGPSFLEKYKMQHHVELVLFNQRGEIIASSQPDFALYKKDSFAKTVLSGPEIFFDLPIRDEPFKFVVQHMKWGETPIVVGLGESKQQVRAFVKKVNYAFFTMVGAIGVLLIFTSIFATRVIVQPVYSLVEAVQSMDVKDKPTEIQVTTNTELGVLQESFNEMSRRMYAAKSELEQKVREVENAYSELKETQARLVHTAKMASLGQLVAGIAHELNNPIGFIYSNMSHLRDYSNRLVKIIEAADREPERLAAIKEECDFEYIVNDMPRLISSCEEGARRTRDIVLGLRNFSRLDESKLKRVNLKEGIENTLKLIAGELKNRVHVHEQFEETPEVLCYASQMNQVFMNILTNAAQAIDGEGEIWISLKHLEDSGCAQVSVRDSGKGMTTEVAEKIFDPFFTTKTVGQGTGLGLSISYGIVKQHGGDIQVKSELGRGTEFVVTIPIEPESVIQKNTKNSS